MAGVVVGFLPHLAPFRNGLLGAEPVCTRVSGNVMGENFMPLLLVAPSSN
jgi:hypothetical protein